jgi:hypothetical protein
MAKLVGGWMKSGKKEIKLTSRGTLAFKKIHKKERN